MVSNIRMEYNISINRCVRLILLHKSVFYYTPKERGDELLRMRMKEIAAEVIDKYRLKYLVGGITGSDGYIRVFRRSNE